MRLVCATSLKLSAAQSATAALLAGRSSGAERQTQRRSRLGASSAELQVERQAVPRCLGLPVAELGSQMCLQAALGVLRGGAGGDICSEESAEAIADR